MHSYEGVLRLLLAIRPLPILVELHRNVSPLENTSGGRSEALVNLKYLRLSTDTWT